MMITRFQHRELLLHGTNHGHTSTTRKRVSSGASPQTHSLALVLISVSENASRRSRIPDLRSADLPLSCAVGHRVIAGPFAGLRHGGGGIAFYWRHWIRTRPQAQRTFQDPERTNWNFVPMPRAGLPLKDMQVHQQHLAHALLNSVLSHRGYSKAMNIMALEQILHDLESSGPTRNPSLYYFLICGEPSPDSTWGWRVEGHHLSVNLTLVDGQQVVPTPSFYGADPAPRQTGPP